jgi:transposase
VARRPSVFVRPLSMDEGRKLARITRSAKNPVRMRRAIVVLMSAQGQTFRDITSLLQVSDDYVRDVIHAFNERGFDALDRKPSGGRPCKIGDQVRAWLCRIARTSPVDWGITASSTWSLAKLREHLLAEGIVAELSRETLRRILHAGGTSWQTTTTWKTSTDPDFIPKMRRVLDLYDHPPDDGRVVCVDDFGLLNLQPRKGKAWRSKRRPRRQRATYTRTSGVMHMLAALDLTTGKLFHRIRDRKRGSSSSISSRRCAPAGPERSYTWSATTSPRTATPASVSGAPRTRSSWCSCTPMDRGRTGSGPSSPRCATSPRPPQSRGAERRHRRLRPPAQRPRPTQDQLRGQLTDPHLDKSPGRRCTTSH